MRDLTQCQAEVFRRSEKRIKERKKRSQQMLMVCMPFVLCAAVVAVLLMPGAASESAGNSSPAAGGGLPEHQAESYLSSIASITVTGHGFSKTVTKPEEILRIWDCLQALRMQEPENNASADGSEHIKQNENHNHPIYSSVADSDYRITLTMWEGEPTGYLLTYSALKDVATGRTYPLTPEQVIQWKALLGIAD